MLIGRDLGFSCLALVVLIFCPVIIFVVRRKWRVAEVRREEIKRLLVMASEEAARAELEASTGYGTTPASVRRQLHFQCALCFCPTTKLCARCKAVRYCSGKCQIIHWRQGHKEECIPFTTIHKINDVECGSSQKAFKQEEYENCGNRFETEGKQFAKPVETFHEDYAFSNSSPSENIEVHRLEDGEGTNSTSKFMPRSLHKGYSASNTCSESSADASVCTSTDSDRSDGLQSTYVAPDKFENICVNTNQNSPPLSKHSTLINSVDSFTSSVKFNQIKLSGSDRDTRCVSSSSSGWSIDDSKESSLSVPSTPSSGFWEGTIDSKKSRIDDLDDSAQSLCSGAGDRNMSGRRSSESFSSESLQGTLPPLDLRASYARTIISDDTGPTATGIKKHIDKAALSEESSKDGLKSRKSPSLSSVTSEHMCVDTVSDLCISKSRDPSYSSSSASCADSASSAGRRSVSKDAKMVSSSRSLNPERSNHVVNDISSTSHTLKSREVGSLSSKASDTHFPSSSGRHLAQIPKSVKVDDEVDRVAACSSQYVGYSQNAGNGLKTSMWKVVDQLKGSKLSRHYPLGAGSEITGRYNYKGLFSYELFIKLYNWKEVELRPCGLINCGNSCYANAVLQCLAFTPPLTAYLLQGLHSKACKKNEWCFTCEFESLVLKAKEGNSPLSPIRILSHMQNIGSHLGNGREEDAHEFLRYAVDTMQSICLKEAGANASGTLGEETTLMGLTFGGYLRSKIRCIKCGGKSERQESMMDLTVEIEGDIGTLEDALRQFTGTEILDGENKYQCSRCKSYEKAKKKLTVLEAPNVLTIALKRFQSGKFGKINKSIRFPEILDLAPYMSGTSYKSTVYRLYGVVVHLDIMNAAFSGHYVCYVRNSQNKWFKIDDSTVKAVELERVLAKGAYMLLYARCSPRAPRSIRNSIIPRDPRKPKSPTSKARSHPIDSVNGQTRIERLYPDHSSYQQIFEEDSSSDNSSSFFSEAGSCSTESSNRDSSSTEDYFDQIFGDLGQNWNSPWRNSSDSDTSSSSSSPSPLYSRHSPLSHLDRYASRHSETSSSQIDYAESSVSDPFLYSDRTKQNSRKEASSSSSRETDSDRLGRVNPINNNIKSGVSFRRSMRVRTD